MPPKALDRLAAGSRRRLLLDRPEAQLPHLLERGEGALADVGAGRLARRQGNRDAAALAAVQQAPVAARAVAIETGEVPRCRARDRRDQRLPRTVRIISPARRPELQVAVAPRVAVVAPRPRLELDPMIALVLDVHGPVIMYNMRRQVGHVDFALEGPLSLLAPQHVEAQIQQVTQGLDVPALALLGLVPARLV